MVGGEKKTRQHFKNGRAGPFLLRRSCRRVWTVVQQSDKAENSLRTSRILVDIQKLCSWHWRPLVGDLSYLLCRCCCALVVVLVEGRNDHELLRPVNQPEESTANQKICRLPRNMASVQKAAGRLEGR